MHIYIYISKMHIYICIYHDRNHSNRNCAWPHSSPTFLNSQPSPHPPVALGSPKHGILPSNGPIHREDRLPGSASSVCRELSGVFGGVYLERAISKNKGSGSQGSDPSPGYQTGMEVIPKKNDGQTWWPTLEVQWFPHWLDHVHETPRDRWRDPIYPRTMGK